MLQKILVPLDGSELAEAVLPYVEEICRRCEPVEVILLQVIPSPAGRSGAVFQSVINDFPTDRLPYSPADVETAQHPIYRGQVMASAQAEVEAALAPVAQRLCGGGMPTRVAVAFGLPADEIVDFAEREGVDLIVMSTHGRGGLSRWVFGSVAEKVLRAIAIPILLIRPPGADRYSRLPGVELKL